MTADFYPFEMKFIGHVATRIINEADGERGQPLLEFCHSHPG